MFHKLLKSFFRSITAKKRGAVLVVLIFAVLLIAPTSIAYGQELEPSIGGGDDGWFASGIAKLIYYLTIPILSWILAAVGTLADYMIQPIQITTSNTVQMGWSITRDFANMFFILILLGIALDYILMGVSFGVKKALPTFIAVALLINFSLPIAGVFIDFSNILTSFFLKEIGGGNFSLVFANLLGLSNVFNAQNVQQAQNATQVGFSTITDVLFADFFLIGTIFVLLSLSVMFLIRTGMLMGLLVVLPLVLVIMPFNRSYWGKWTGKFMQYIMFGPAAMFFLYLSMKIFEGNVMTNMGASISATQGKQGFLDQIVQYLVVWFFMGGSLVAANSFGVHGSGAALKMFKQGEGWVKGKIKGGGKWVGRKTWEGAKGAAGEGAKSFGAPEKLDKMAEFASQHGGLIGRWTARKIRRAAVGTEQAIKRQGELSKQDKEILGQYNSKRLYEEMLDREKSISPFGKVQAAQISEILASRKDLKATNEDGTLNKEKTKDLVKRMHKTANKYFYTDTAKNILNSNLEAKFDVTAEAYEGRTADWINPKTGKNQEQAYNDMFDITTIDMEKNKHLWTPRLVERFVKSGHFNTRFLRKAQDIGDNNFIDYTNTLLEQDTIEGMPTAKWLGKNNKALLNAVMAGNTAEVGILKGISEKISRQTEEEEKQKKEPLREEKKKEERPPLGV